MIVKTALPFSRHRAMILGSIALCGSSAGVVVLKHPGRDK
jgi:hypothetical protein